MSPRLVRAVVVAGIAVGTLSCADKHTVTGPDDVRPRQDPLPPPTLVQVSGDTQVTIPRGLVIKPLVVRAVDADGKPVAGALVRWTGDGNSRFRRDTMRTRYDGSASGIWILGATHGEYHATATVDGAPAIAFSARADSSVRMRLDPDTLRFSALGDTARVMLRVTNNGVITFATTSMFGWHQQNVVRYVETPVAVLQSLNNGTVTLWTQFGDTLFHLPVVVAQQPVGMRITLDGRAAGATDTLSLGPDAVRSLAYTAVDRNGYAVPDMAQAATWTSSDTAVVTVTGAGAARGINDGVATVTAASGALTATTPVRVWTLDAQSVVTGWGYNCAHLRSGALACWGMRSLGWYNGLDETAVPEYLPFGAFTSVTLSSTHACGLRAGGEAYCWGRNREGELGSGWVDSVSRTPRRVAGGHQFTSISAGEVGTCGLTAAGKVWCWGNGGGGMLGNGTYGDASCAEGCSSVPVEVASSIPFASIHSGSGSTCALTAAGEAYCWGYNNLGELGSQPVDCNGWIYGSMGNAQCSPVPVRMDTDLRFKSLSLGTSYACGIALDGSAHCWGTFVNGERGSPQPLEQDTAADHRPARVASNERFASIAAGFRHACALTEAGEAWCWGSGAIGSGVAHPDVCRNGACTRTPARVAGGITFARLSSHTHTCGISTAGVTYCWGLGDLSANGDGTRIARNTPTRVLYQRP